MKKRSAFKFFFVSFFLLLHIFSSLTIKTFSESSGLQFVIPKRAIFWMGTSLYNNERVPAFLLYAWAEVQCLSVSNLKVKETYTKDKLVVDVMGYHCKAVKWPICYADTLPGTLVCPMPISIPASIARIRINMNWLKKNNKKEIVFRLRGKENRYRVNYEKYEINLRSAKVSNVIDYESRHKPKLALPIVLKTVVYPADVGILYLSGKPSADGDYGEALIRFAYNYGFVPADKVYKGVLQTKHDELYVVVGDNPLPSPAHSIFIGCLPENKNVKVLIRKVFDRADEIRQMISG